MKRINLIVIFLLAGISVVHAQMPLSERQEGSSDDRFIDHLTFGGNFGLQFGTQTYIELAPIVGYKLTDQFIAGISLKYIYYKFNDDISTYSSHIYGGGPFARYFILDGLFLHVEYEILNLEVPDLYYRKFTRQNISSVFAGGGYRQMIGESSSIDFLILYNLNESTLSPYENPVIRIGFGLGI